VNGVGLNAIEGSLITLFPVPVSDNLTLLIPDYLVGSIAELWDMSGKKINTFILNSTTCSLDFKAFAPGTYMLKIGDVFKEKVIKK
jgi:hypothetical protein